MLHVARKFCAVFRWAKQHYEGDTHQAKLTVSLGMVMGGCLDPAEVLREDMWWLLLLLYVVCGLLSPHCLWAFSVPWFSKPSQAFLAREEKYVLEPEHTKAPPATADWHANKDSFSQREET